MDYRTVPAAALIVVLLAPLAAAAQDGRDAASEVPRRGVAVYPGPAVHRGEDAAVAAAGRMPEPVRPPRSAPPPVVALAFSGAVHFAFDRTDLDAVARKALDGLLRRARDNGRVDAVRITGHADRIGNGAYNLDLSLRRAHAVNAYLVQHVGPDRWQTEIVGRGESEPLIDCAGETEGAAIRCLAPNRRVEVRVEVTNR